MVSKCSLKHGHFTWCLCYFSKGKKNICTCSLQCLDFPRNFNVWPIMHWEPLFVNLDFILKLIKIKIKAWCEWSIHVSKGPIAPVLDVLMSCYQFASKSRNVHLSKWTLNNKWLILFIQKPEFLNYRVWELRYLNFLKNQKNLQMKLPVGKFHDWEQREGHFSYSPHCWVCPSTDCDWWCHQNKGVHLV